MLPLTREKEKREKIRNQHGHHWLKGRRSFLSSQPWLIRFPPSATPLLLLLRDFTSSFPWSIKYLVERTAQFKLPAPFFFSFFLPPSALSSLPEETRPAFPFFWLSFFFFFFLRSLSHAAVPISIPRRWWHILLISSADAAGHITYASTFISKGGRYSRNVCLRTEYQVNKSFDRWLSKLRLPAQIRKKRKEEEQFCLVRRTRGTKTTSRRIDSILCLFVDSFVSSLPRRFVVVL